MRRELILHIGTQKTGSTSIQHYFYKNRAELTRQGVYYPDFGPWNPNHAILAFAGQNRRGFPDWLPQEYQNTASLQRVVTTALDKVHDLPEGVTTFLSFENFYTAIDRHLADFLRDVFGRYSFELRILVYLRRPSDHIFSLYHQRLKNVSEPAPDFEKFCQTKTKYYEYANNIQQIEKKLGVSDSIVRDYSNRSNSVINDLFSLLDIGVDSKVKPETLNLKLSNDGFLMLEEFHARNYGRVLTSFEITEALKMRDIATTLAGDPWVKDLDKLPEEYQRLDSDYSELFAGI
jgi:hypothetical protein